MTQKDKLIEQGYTADQISDYYREMGRKSWKNRTKPHRGGFNTMSKERLRKIAIEAGKKGKRGKAKDNTPTN